MSEVRSFDGVAIEGVLRELLADVRELREDIAAQHHAECIAPLDQVEGDA